MNDQVGRASEEPKFDVVWPLGKLRLDGTSNFPAPLASLDGKTVGELWDWLYKGDSLFPIVREELRKHYPNIKFVEYPVFGNIHGPDEADLVRHLPERMSELGCDAVIVGVGH
jgi:hypothetical protein